MDENWKEGPSPGYLVSDKGRVFSKRSGRYVQPYSSRGYLQVDLGGKIWTVSHLVWFIFKGEKPYRLVYLDGNTGNPALSNLEKTETLRNFLMEEENAIQ